jgi:acetyl esterase/lipase
MALTRRRLLGGFGALSLVGVVEALRHLGSPGPKPKVVSGTTRLVEHYGPSDRQRGEWWVPPTGTGPLPLVVLVHGGYWRPSYDLTLEDAVAADLAGRGFLVWNIDYAPSSDPWPATLTDAAAAYDFAFKGHYASRIDKARVAVVGHSAGGHLALWLASRSRLPAGAVGAGPHVVPVLAIPQAPVASLVTASVLGLGGGAVDALLGGSPRDVPDRYAIADPVALVPSGVRTVLVHGTADPIVPLSQSEDYLKVAGPLCTLVKVPGDHFTHLDPTSEAIAALRTALATL